MITDKEFISEALTFVGEYGATEYRVESSQLEDVCVKVVFIKNPGWSVSRMTNIYNDLNKHMLDYCRLNESVSLFESVRLLIE